MFPGFFAAARPSPADRPVLHDRPTLGFRGARTQNSDVRHFLDEEPLHPVVFECVAGNQNEFGTGVASRLNNAALSCHASFRNSEAIPLLATSPQALTSPNMLNGVPFSQRSSARRATSRHHLTLQRIEGGPCR